MSWIVTATSHPDFLTDDNGMPIVRAYGPFASVDRALAAQFDHELPDLGPGQSWAVLPLRHPSLLATDTGAPDEVTA
jgi:hypothetical protein